MGHLIQDMSNSKTLMINVAEIFSRFYKCPLEGQLDQYFMDCARYQFWVDLVGILNNNALREEETSKELETQLRKSIAKVDQSAYLVVGNESNTASFDFMSEKCISNVFLKLQSKIPPVALDKVLCTPMPECCGYNIASPALISKDARYLIDQVGLDRAFLVVGIRTGGAYLAPLWKAALINQGASNVHWCTMRPQDECAICEEIAAARAWLEKQLLDPVIIVVDDRPDTGLTMNQVAATLRGASADLWFSYIGKVWRGSAALPLEARVADSISYMDRAFRLWECLLPRDHSKFIARLRDSIGIAFVPSDVHVFFRCRYGEMRYGSKRAWLPWNDQRITNASRPLVNPRKTPLEIISSDGKTLLHLRFIGEGIFGRAEFERVREMSSADDAWFVDGYAITKDIGPTQRFDQYYHICSSRARSELLIKVAKKIAIKLEQAVAYYYQDPIWIPLVRRWESVIADIRELCGYDPTDEISAALRVFLHTPVPWPGRLGSVFRSSLSYTCGGWHWQVDGYGHVHQFQIEANWGGTSFIELEIAVFVLENKLSNGDAKLLSSFCECDWADVQKSLSLAALIIAECRLNSVKLLTTSGKINMINDFQILLRSTSNLSETE